VVPGAIAVTVPVVAPIDATAVASEANVQLLLVAPSLMVTVQTA
jgi:hypothetical protein